MQLTKGEKQMQKSESKRVQEAKRFAKWLESKYPIKSKEDRLKRLFK